MKSLEKLLDELEQEFYESKGFLWSKKSLIDVDKCTALLAQLRAGIPVQMQDINYLQSEKGRLINSAEKIIGEAERRANAIVSESELVRRAEYESERIKKEAINGIKEYENTAMKRLSAMLTDIESFLVEAVNIVRTSRSDLELNVQRNAPKADAAVTEGTAERESQPTYDELIDSIN